MRRIRSEHAECSFSGPSESFFAVAVILSAMTAVFSCDMLGGPDGGDTAQDVSSMGEIRTAFCDFDHLTRAGVILPDTSDFHLVINEASGKNVYDGRYGDCPEILPVTSGTYNIYVESSRNVKPAFDSPVYGDEQCVIVPSSGKVNVRLTCRQLNCGVRLRIDRDFPQRYPESSLVLKSSGGSLLYSFSERRFAYFPPGNVSIVMSSGGDDRVMMTRMLSAQDMLTIGVVVPESVPDEVSGAMSISVDTSRNWIVDECIIGNDLAYDPDTEKVMTVSEAMSSAGRKEIWVSGYIVGGDFTSASVSFESPFVSRTNMALGPRSSTSVRSSCISVQLPSGDIRENINLVDNPDLLGRRILLKGDLVASYFGLVGLKNITAYELP